MLERNCLRCGAPMRHVGREKLQLGQTGWFLGNLPNLFAGAIEVDIMICAVCGKVEFFCPPDLALPSDTPQQACPRCGKKHDFDDPKCPYCGYDYYGKER